MSLYLVLELKFKLEYESENNYGGAHEKDSKDIHYS